MTPGTVKHKVEELAAALKAEGFWKKTEPEWVSEFKVGGEIPDVNFYEWLQFVYLPNRMLNQYEMSGDSHEKYITLQAKKFAGEKLMSERILQLLVELDSM